MHQFENLILFSARVMQQQIDRHREERVQLRIMTIKNDETLFFYYTNCKIEINQGKEGWQSATCIEK